MSNVLETNKMMEDVLRSLGLSSNPSSEELLNSMEVAIKQQKQNNYTPELPGYSASQEYSAGVNMDTPMTVEGVDVNQSAPVQYSSGTLQSGLLGQIPTSNNLSEQMLSDMQSKNQANTQSMMNIGQQGIQAGMQAAQGLQAQRQSAMDATSQQAAQAIQQQQQQQAGLGNLLGGLIKHFFIPVKFGGGRK